MAVISTFYAGSVDAAAFSAGIARVGNSEYGVVGTNDLKVTAVSGQDRTVSVTAGQCWGKGVHDVLSPAQTIALPSVASGNRWDLITMRRTWSSKNSVITRVTGGSARAIPTGRLNSYGTVDDQPLALVRVKAGSTSIQEIIDLRAWSANGGLVIVDAMAMGYLARPGAQVYLAGVMWQYAPASNGVFGWRPQGTIFTYGFVQPSGWNLSGQCRVTPVGSLKRVDMDVNLTRTGPTFNIGTTFSGLGRVIATAARGNSGPDKYFPISVSGGTNGNNKTAGCYVDTATGDIKVRSTEGTWAWQSGAVSTINIHYYI